jgi:serine protease AprX
MAIDKELIKDARKTVNNLFGKSLEKKASDAFCLAFGLDTAGDGGLESFTESVPIASRAAVLEFSNPTDLLGDLQKNADKLMNSRKWGIFEKALKDLPIAGDFLMTSAKTIRQSMAQHLRDDFQKAAGAIKSDIESKSDFQPGPEAVATPSTPSAVTERCWLNRTMRTWVPPHHLREIMADDNIDLIDVPHMIELEMLTTVLTVAAPDYRQRKNVTGKGVIVAVIDGEVALDHPAFGGRVIQKQNYCAELWGNPHFHGTAVAGIIAANDPAGVFAGIAPGATIYNYKVAATKPGFNNADDFGGARALQQALDDGADIANCSWGPRVAGDGTSREAVACNTAWSLGMSIVKSAGNRGGSGDGRLTTPAEADGVIVVGATGQDGLSVQDYSSHGPAPNGKLRPHLVAPGGMRSAGMSCLLTGGGFGPNVPVLAGTSFAAPHIAGMLALLLEEQPNMTPDAQRDLLIAACRQLDPHDPNFAGAGLAVMSDIP